MKRTSFPLAAVVAFLRASAAHAGQPADVAHFSIMSPVQAAYEAYQVETNRTQNTMGNIEAELPEPVTAERREVLAVDGAAEPAEGFKPEVWVNIGGFSHHFDRKPNYNESNLGFGIEWRRTREVAIMAGVYKNSVGKPSQYAAVNWQPWQIGPVKLGAAIGVLNGYPAFNRGGTFFAALPVASIEVQRFGVNIGLIPSIGSVAGALLVQLKMRLY